MTPSAKLRVAQVFVPGKFPEHTYNPRETLELEQRVADYVDEGGAILTVAGPTKTGKSVLIRHVIPSAAWVDGQGLQSADDLWRRLADKLGLFTSLQLGTDEGAAKSGAASVQGGLPFLKGQVDGGYERSEHNTRGLAVDRPLASVVRDFLNEHRTPIVLDDFHFMTRETQREVVRAVKPIVFAGSPVVFIAISHRVQDVVTAEADMTGRLSSLLLELWSTDDLVTIARKGFDVLNLDDPASALAQRLAAEAYGSPHLMQKFCRELVKDNGIREGQDQKTTLQPPTVWDDFFRRQADEASADWYQRLLRGPQEKGQKRTQFTLKDGRVMDGYGLTLAAIQRTGPALSIDRDTLRSSIDALVKGAGPALHQTTRVLQHMTKIASKRSIEVQPTEEELDAETPAGGISDAQPVLEYVENEALSTLHIADPFFAYYIKWASDRHLSAAQSPTQT